MISPPKLDKAAADHLRTHFERFGEAEEARRRERAWQRKLLWDEDFAELVKRHIRLIYRDAEVRKRMTACVSVTCNPGKDITQAVACVYKRGAHRLLTGATEEEEREWRRLLGEQDIVVQAPEWNRWAFLCGPTLVAPFVVEGRLMRELILPHQAQVAIDRQGQVEAAVWAVPGYYGTERDPRRWRDVRYVYVDREAWHYIDTSGRPMAGPDGREYLEHGVRDEYGPACPVAVMRLDTPTLPDWWSSSSNERLLSGTVEASFLWARLDMVRARQDHRFLFATERTKGAFPDQQLAGGDPEASIIASEPSGLPTLNPVDYVTAPDGHLAHLRTKIGQLAMSFGIPPDSIAFNFAGGETKALSIRLSSEQQAAIVAGQVPHLRLGERRLAVLTAGVVRAARHPRASKLPGPIEVADRFVFEVRGFHRSEDPRVRREDDEWRMRLGLTSIVELAQAEWDLPAAEAEARLRKNKADNAALAANTDKGESKKNVRDDDASNDDAGDRPGTGDRPGAGDRPGTGDQPGTGDRPGAGDTRER